MPRGTVIEVVALHLFLILLQALGVMSVCSTPEPHSPKMVQETDPVGTVLFTMMIDREEVEWRFTIDSPQTSIDYLQRFFSLVIDDNSWKFVVAKILDVEAIFKEKVNFSREIDVEPVDEYQPTFTVKNTTITILEEDPLGSVVLDLNKYVLDHDLEYLNNLFTSHPMANTLDILTNKFRVTAKGLIVINEIVDYENGDRLFHMNVSFMQSQRNFMTVNIIIENKNDNSPRFWYAGCNGDCVDTLYATSTSACRTGLIERYKYGPIIAIDPDDEPVVYTIIHASPTDANDMVHINETTGDFQVTHFLKKLNRTLVGFIIQAADTRMFRTDVDEWRVRSELTGFLIEVEFAGC